MRPRLYFPSLTSRLRQRLPVYAQSTDDDLMHYGILPDRRQIDLRLSHIKWIDLLAAENVFRRRIGQIVGHATGTDGTHINVMRATVEPIPSLLNTSPKRSGRDCPWLRASSDINVPSKLARFSLGMGAE